MKPILKPCLGFLAAWLMLADGQAAEVAVAVASNFTAPMQRIAADFERDTGHKATLSFGATGKFYAQISHGAPFEVLLSADDETPARLENEGYAVKGSRFTYAIGRLVLWSPQPGRVDTQGAVLAKADFNRLAIANPKTAPYGKAAVEALTKTGLLKKVQSKFVYGESINQAVQYAMTAAEIGFVAKSSMKGKDMLKFKEGKDYIDVDPSLYAPIDQGIVILKHGENNPEAKAFYDFIMSNKAKDIFHTYGYLVPQR